VRVKTQIVKIPDPINSFRRYFGSSIEFQPSSYAKLIFPIKSHDQNEPKRAPNSCANRYGFNLLWRLSMKVPIVTKGFTYPPVIYPVRLMPRNKEAAIAISGAT
jgi:hypothetical protein